MHAARRAGRMRRPGRYLTYRLQENLTMLVILRPRAGRLNLLMVIR
jgi:hypothetical protein